MKIRRRARLSLLVSLFLLGPCLRPATAQLLGPEFQVNTYATGYQRVPAVAADGSGNFVVVWESDCAYCFNGSVFGQRFNPAGSRVGSEFQVNSYTTGAQHTPSVAADSSGNFVVVWTSYQDGSDAGVFGQRFNAAGSPLGSEFRVNSFTTGSQRAPAVAVDGLGNFVVVWTSDGPDGARWSVVGQRYNSAGSPLGSEFQVNSYTTSYQWVPAVTADVSGNFVVVWPSLAQDGDNWGVFGQRFNAAGIRQGSEFQVNTYTTGDQLYPKVAANAAGDFVVVWQSAPQDGSNWGVFGRRFNAAGVPQGSEFQVNSYTTSFQYLPEVAADAAGNFVVTWNGNLQDGSFGGIFGRRYTSAGGPLGSDFQINAYTMGRQDLPAVAADGLGNFVVVWQSFQDGSYTGVFGRRMIDLIFADGF